MTSKLWLWGKPVEEWNSKESLIIIQTSEVSYIDLPLNLTFYFDFISHRGSEQLSAGHLSKLEMQSEREREVATAVS